MKQINIIALWPNLYRAIEIAKNGGFSVSICFDPDHYPEGYDDTEIITEFYKGFFDNFVGNGDLKIEIAKPSTYLNPMKYHALILEDFTPCSIYEVEEPNNVSLSLLKNAENKLSLSLKAIMTIHKVAKVIACIDKSKEVKVEHIAESIQYSFVNEDCITLTGNLIHFGKHITISEDVQDHSHINNAIEYLQFKLNETL